MIIRKSRLVLVWILISIAAMVIAALMIEVYLRCTSSYIARQKDDSLVGFVRSDPEYLVRETPRGRRLVPNAHVVIRHHYLSGQDIAMNINSLGFRGPEIPKEKKANELRILVLGDSITWGDYLQEDQVYVSRIASYLGESIHGWTIQVINGGVGNIGTREEVAILQEQGLALSPDIVILTFYLNDSCSPWDFSPRADKTSGILRHSLLAQRLYRRLKLWRWIQDKGEYRFSWIYQQHQLDWAHKRKEFLRLVSLARYDWGSAWEPRSWRAVEQEFKKLKGLSREHHFAVLLAVLPVSFQVYADFIEDTPQQMLRKEAAEFGFYYLDLLPVLRRYRDRNLYFDYCHPRQNANDIMGMAIADFIKREMLSGINLRAFIPDLKAEDECAKGDYRGEPRALAWSAKKDKPSF